MRSARKEKSALEIQILAWQSEYLYNFLYLYRRRYLSKHVGWIRSGKSKRFPSNSVCTFIQSYGLKGQFGKGEASVGSFLLNGTWAGRVGVHCQILAAKSFFHRHFYGSFSCLLCPACILYTLQQNSPPWPWIWTGLIFHRWYCIMIFKETRLGPKSHLVQFKFWWDKCM